MRRCRKPVQSEACKYKKKIIMSYSYKDKIYNIAANAFEVACYMFPLQEWEITEKEKIAFDGNKIRSVISFNGAASGKMIFEPSSENFLTAIAANMLGIEDPDEKEKSGALCEIANIVCGNTVPLFAHDDQICFIEPPAVLAGEVDMDEGMETMKKESVQVFLDEGAVRITVYYAMEEEL